MSHGLDSDRHLTRAELMQLRERPVHVIGAASAEGVAVARLLIGLGFTDVTVHDQRPRAELRAAFRTTHGAYRRIEQDQIWDELRPVIERGRFGDEYLSGMEDAALVSLGQGWYLDPSNRRRIVDCVPAAARVTSMSALYAELHRGPFAAVTGTNGKSTTVALIEHLLERGGVTHRTSGNERSSRQFLPEIDDVAPGTWALLETSNRQLLQLAWSPSVAAITALTPDHLEEHGGFDGYREAKARLFARQEPGDIAIANADDVEALAVARRGAGRLVQCGIGARPGAAVCWIGDSLVAIDAPIWSSDDQAQRLDGEHVLASTGDLLLPGAHNQRNAAVAAAVALACGVPVESIAPALREFRGKSLRLQCIDTVAGIEVWSDLKSTTPEATIAALDALADRRVHLISGGIDKGLDYGPLARSMQARGVHAWVVPGTATDALERALEGDGAGSLLQRVDTLVEALDSALDAAASGECVIVSPAAAGFWTSQLQGGASLARLVRERATGALQEVPER